MGTRKSIVRDEPDFLRKKEENFQEDGFSGQENLGTVLDSESQINRNMYINDGKQVLH